MGTTKGMVAGKLRRVCVERERLRDVDDWWWMGTGRTRWVYGAGRWVRALTPPHHRSCGSAAGWLGGHTNPYNGWRWRGVEKGGQWTGVYFYGGRVEIRVTPYRCVRHPAGHKSQGAFYYDNRHLVLVPSLSPSTFPPANTM